jgi:YVTN family beta-propeller protein
MICREEKEEVGGRRMKRYRNLLLALAAGVGLFAGSRGLKAQGDAEPHGRTIHPRALAFNLAAHRLYAVDQDENRVLVVDGHGTQSFIAVGRQPNSIVIDPAVNRIYVVNAGSGNVSVIDGATDRVVATVPTDARPYAIGIDTSLHRAYVTNTFSNKVTVIDGATNSAQQLPVGSKDFVETDAHRRRAFFISYEDLALTMLDPENKVHRVDLGLSHPWGLAIDQQRGIVYVTEIGRHTLVAYHENDGRTDRISTGLMPDAVAVDEAANRIYVANYDANSVTVIDGGTMRPVATVAVGTHPQALAVDSRRHTVLVANTHSNNVTVIDTVRNMAVATIPGGASPYAVAVDPDTDNAYVANYGSHPLTKLNLPSTH